MWLRAANGDAVVSKNACHNSLNRSARFSPLRQRQRRSLSLRTEVGEITLLVDYGQDGQSGRWYCPVQEQWGLRPHQKLTPGLVEKLGFTATATGSYQKATEVAAKWGQAVEDSTVRAHVQVAGARAEAHRQQRGDNPPLVGPVPQALVIMMDGWLVRQRGPDWGRKPARRPGQRVLWQECKSAVIYRLEQAAQTRSGRGLLVEKFVVAYPGEPVEFGRQVQAEARRRGLGAAQRVYVVADGSVWIWNVAADRFAGAREVWDFYHASQHLWAVAHALHGEGTDAARAWVQPLLHQLRHGHEQRVLKRLSDLPGWCAQRGQVVPEAGWQGRDYFEHHRHRLQYRKRASEGCPVGSGAMESFCAQLQGRFKRCGQFWRPPGRDHLLALELAHRNGDWDDLWVLN